MCFESVQVASVGKSGWLWLARIESLLPATMGLHLVHHTASRWAVSSMRTSTCWDANGPFMPRQMLLRGQLAMEPDLWELPCTALMARASNARS
jgi:hypothetical protein